ncbi:unnamed protein product [Penicillium camemberti]|uniref:Str. FM013 n=1 Tax=Penicillium camemberti (strain FM 013) TaxID=1429867 RepID=A0A0G4PD76_PENC3|nr:unnamed protein product [Penicillium camemberti]
MVILLSDFGNTFSPAQEKRFESHTPLLSDPRRPDFSQLNPSKFHPISGHLDAPSILDIIAQSSLFEGLFADDFESNEQDALFSMLRSMFSFKPENRGSS